MESNDNESVWFSDWESIGYIYKKGDGYGI